MSDALNESLPPDGEEFARHLRTLTPRPAAVDRAAVHAAGAAIAPHRPPSARRWKFAAAAGWATAAGLLVAQVLRPEPPVRVVERVVVRTVTTPAATDDRAAGERAKKPAAANPSASGNLFASEKDFAEPPDVLASVTAWLDRPGGDVLDAGLLRRLGDGPRPFATFPRRTPASAAPLTPPEPWDALRAGSRRL